MIRALLLVLALAAWGGLAHARIQQPDGLPTPSLDCQFGGPVSGTTTIAAGPRCPAVTFSRTGSTATHCDATGAIVTDAANIPRYGYDCQTHAFLGLLIEDTRTNSALNSLTPTTQTTASLATGAWTLSVVGPGSVTSSAGTAVGTGFGVATAGSPVSMALTGAGTVVLTVAGSPTCMQMEAGAFATSCIITTGAAAARNRDVATIASLGTWFNTTGGTLEATAVWPNLPTGATSSLVQIDDGTGSGNNNRITIRLIGSTPLLLGTTVVSSAAVNINGSSAGVIAGAVQRAAFTFVPGQQQFGQNSQPFRTSAPSATLPPGQALLRIGANASTNTECNCGILRIQFWPIPLWGGRLQQAVQSSGDNSGAGSASTAPLVVQTVDFRSIAPGGTLPSPLRFQRPDFADNMATDWQSDGFLHELLINQPRFGAYTQDGHQLGIGHFPRATTRLNFPRDVTNVIWTKTNMSVVYNRTGLDGVSTSAPTLTATASNATLTQITTFPTFDQTFSAFIRRISGTGTVSVGVGSDCATIPWVDVTATIGSSTLVQVPALGATTVAVTNPCFGLKLGTSGDAVSWDAPMLEVLGVTDRPAVQPIYAQTIGSGITATDLLSVLANDINLNTASFVYVAQVYLDYIGFEHQMLMSLSDGHAAHGNAVFANLGFADGSVNFSGTTTIDGVRQSVSGVQILAPNGMHAGLNTLAISYQRGPPSVWKLSVNGGAVSSATYTDQPLIDPALLTTVSLCSNYDDAISPTESCTGGLEWFKFINVAVTPSDAYLIGLQSGP